MPIFKSSSQSEVADILSLFGTLKSIEIKNKPLDQISKKRGYKIDYISDISSYQSKIRTPESNSIIYNRGQHIADSLYKIELKKGKASDNVVGQIQRYMGYVKDMLAEEGQSVRGIIIALEDDVKIRRALSVTQNIEFYRYEINFKLKKV